MKKNLISVLKKFFMKLSGQEPEGNNLVDIIDSGSNALGENDSTEPFVVTFSGTTADDKAAFDKTFTEIKAAIDANKNVVAKHIEGSAGSGNYAVLTLCAYGDSYINFTCYDVVWEDGAPDSMFSRHCSITNTGSVSISEYEM